MEETGLWSKAKYYVTIGVAALGIGTCVGTNYHDEVDHALDVVDYGMIRAGESIEKHMPGSETIKKMVEYREIHVLGRADSPEDLDRQAQQKKADVQRRLREYEQMNSQNPTDSR